MWPVKSLIISSCFILIPVWPGVWDGISDWDTAPHHERLCWSGDWTRGIYSVVVRYGVVKFVSCSHLVKVVTTACIFVMVHMICTPPPHTHTHTCWRDTAVLCQGHAQCFRVVFLCSKGSPPPNGSSLCLLFTRGMNINVHVCTIANSRFYFPVQYVQ